MKTAIGIDIGGTKVAIVLGTRHGKILAHRKITTQKEAHVKDSVNELISIITELTDLAKKQKHLVLGIGVGIPGAVNPHSGVVPKSPHMKGWKGVKLKKILEDRFLLPVIMANDANAAAVGKKVFGLAKKCKDFIYMTVSTGVGGGIFTNGKLLEGASYVAGEVGHMVIVRNGNQCDCGSKGCLEAYASGTAIAKYFKSEVRKGKKTSLTKRLKVKDITARDIGLAARKGDALAKHSFAIAAEYLGVGISNLLNILNPELVILGGGVWTTAPKLFWVEMMKNCRKHAWPEAFKRVQIRRSKLKGSIGDLGALALVFEKIDNS